MKKTEITDRLKDLTQRCLQSDDRLIAETHLTPAALNFFTALPPDADYLTCAEIADAMRLSPSRASRILDRMVNEGYISRTTASEDRRCIRISLTRKGRQAKKKVNQYRCACENKIENNFTLEEISGLKYLLDKLSRTI